jgi:hypothetical protein
MAQPAESREWVLEAETEYRFELDPKTSLAIKVCLGTNFFSHYASDIALAH